MGRITVQKKNLHDEINKTKSFFNAYELHERVAKKSGKIGLATIYRFLNSMEDEGKIHSFICNKKKVYSIDKTSHAHFRCEKCGKMKHLEIKNAEFLSRFTSEDICHFQIEVSGICSDCKKLAV